MKICFQSMLRSTKIIMSFIISIAIVGLTATPDILASAYAVVLSDCSKDGYYMASSKNSIRTEIGGEIIGHLSNVKVYKFNTNEFVKDVTGLTWVKVKNEIIRETGKKAEGFICLSYCDYLGTDDDCCDFKVANITRARESFYYNSKTIEILKKNDIVTLLNTGDSQLYSPTKCYWVDLCDIELCNGMEEEIYFSPYEDFSYLDYSYNENAFYNENQKIVYLHFIARGFPEASACAIAANAYAESCCIPTAWCVDRNGLISYGMFQWNGFRKDSLEQWCAERNYTHTDIYAQLAYLDWELENWYTYIYNTMLDNSLTASEAAYFWAAKFEVCSKKYWQVRAKSAENLYNNVTCLGEKEQHCR